MGILLKVVIERYEVLKNVIIDMVVISQEGFCMSGRRVKGYETRRRDTEEYDFGRSSKRTRHSKGIHFFEVREKEWVGRDMFTKALNKGCMKFGVVQVEKG